ncbi:synaptogenesis protein syg-2-like isoform X2 [Magallana gigas]|uniref:synaptogenesis protein syg-2-like isoform X2 n=1 Tax=Magallana gigas TaxID=29159 RepID=UPI003340E8A1
MACDFRTFSVLQGSFLFPVLLSISLFSGIYSQISLPGNPNLAGDNEKNEGETVTLSCSAIGGNPLPSVQWYKNQQLVDPGSSSSGNGDGIYTVGSSTVTYNNYTFTASRSDNRVSYICKVQSSVMASPMERAWTISIYVPSEQPFISGPDPAITTALHSGSTYKFICTAQNGRPVPHLRWKLGTSLSSAVEIHQGITEKTTTNADSTLSKSSTLSWVPIVDDNGKNLYCQTNQTTAGAGTIQKSTSVPIVVQHQALPGNPNLAGDHEKNEGETVTLSCSTVGGNPLPSVQWYKNQQLVDPGSSSSGNGDGIYTVGSSTVTYNNYTFTVSRSDNLVSYICKVQNSRMADPLDRAWTISIYVPSEQPFISGPDPAITTALHSGSTYKYICTAQNSRPVPHLRWKLGTSLLSAVEIHQGITEKTTTNADSTLSKSSTLSWVPIVDDNGKNLYCQTDQTTAGAGTIQKSTSVPIVVQPLPGNPNLAGDYEKNEGETVTLSCSAIGGNPLPSVQWYKNQQLVDPGSSSSGNGDGIYTVGSSTVTYNNYTFTVSRSDNLVSYICKVQNSLMASPLERAWTISIYVPSEQPFISSPDPAITTALNSGSTYKYICTAQNGRPVPNLRWKLGTSLLSAVEFHQGITEKTTTNADSTLSKSSTLSWVPIVDDNGKNLYCQTDQTTARAGTIQKSTSVPIVVQHTLSLPHHDDGTPIAVVVGVTLGTLFVIIIVIGMVVIARRRCRQEAGDRQSSNHRDVINTRGDVHEHVYEQLSFANNHI